MNVWIGWWIRTLTFTATERGQIFFWLLVLVATALSSFDIQNKWYDCWQLEQGLPGPFAFLGTSRRRMAQVDFDKWYTDQLSILLREVQSPFFCESISCHFERKKEEHHEKWIPHTNNWTYHCHLNSVVLKYFWGTWKSLPVVCSSFFCCVHKKFFWAIPYYHHLDRQSCRNTIVLNYELEILLKTSATISELGT